MMDPESAYRYWLMNADDEGIKGQLAAMSEAERREAFAKELEFGTGGLRGIMGAGTNRVNVYTVGRATQGLCDYLKKEAAAPSVVIAFDSRDRSEEFARLAARVIAANGGRAHLFPELMPTPVLSFAVRELRCQAGVVVTASHNPAAYNGYKVYGGDGCQITLEAARAVEACIGVVDAFRDVKKMPFSEGVEAGKISFVPEKLLGDFLKKAERCCINPEVLCGSDLSVIYTPLNGTGNKPVRKALANAGLRNVTVVSSQEKPDGGFPTCQKPNPEERAAFSEALKVAETVPADLLLATDPDCDRVGIAVKSGGGYALLTGNETGCLLLFYILSQKKERNLLPKEPVVIKTIVTSAMAYSIAKDFGAKVIDTLTGFKFIGEQIGVLEKEGQEYRYVFGFEESYGYLPGTYVRDKDAVSSALLICEMAAYCKRRGFTLIDALEKLYRRYGYWKHRLVTFAFEGVGGMEGMANAMADFRKDSGIFAGLEVIKTDDYLRGVSAERTCGKMTPLTLPRSDVLAFSLERGCEIVIRPSGTEPKLKCYLTACSKSGTESEKLLDKLEKDLAKRITPGLKS